jgi:hypothetical protein
VIVTCPPVSSTADFSRRLLSGISHECTGI